MEESRSDDYPGAGVSGLAQLISLTSQIDLPGKEVSLAFGERRMGWLRKPISPIPRGLGASRVRIGEYLSKMGMVIQLSNTIRPSARDRPRLCCAWRNRIIFLRQSLNKGFFSFTMQGWGNRLGPVKFRNNAALLLRHLREWQLHPRRDGIGIGRLANSEGRGR